MEELLVAVSVYTANFSPHHQINQTQTIQHCGSTITITNKSLVSNIINSIGLAVILRKY
jgi:hypothetical protein